jgi:hypothetical protein
MTVCIDLRRNNGSKTLIGVSSEACNIIEIGSFALHFADPTEIGIRESTSLP